MDLFGNQSSSPPVRINIYADEVQSKECPYTKDDWFYIGILVEKVGKELLPDVLDARYFGNYDKDSVYFCKNDRIIHWTDISDIDTKNICDRWLNYILDPSRSEKFFHAYVLGLNNSKLNKHEFGDEQEFNWKYNRFFRSAILYAVKCFFPSDQVIIENIFHEQGQQQNHEYFPWHCIYKIERGDEKISCSCDRVTFLPKSHRNSPVSNIIQLCDLFMGVCTTCIHGLLDSNSSKYKAELLRKSLPLIQRMIGEPNNRNSRYRHANRIMIRNFPRERTDLNEIRRLTNQFYSVRRLHYLEQISGQMLLL